MRHFAPRPVLSHCGNGVNLSEEGKVQQIEIA